MQKENQLEEVTFHIPSITTKWQTFKTKIDPDNPDDLEKVALMTEAAKCQPQSMMEFLIRLNELYHSKKK